MAARPSAFALNVYKADNQVVVSVAGEIDMATSPALRARLIELVQAGVQRITVDMTETEFIDSTGLHALVVGVQELRLRGGDLVVRSPSRSAARLLQLTGLDTIVRVV